MKREGEEREVEERSLFVCIESCLLVCIQLCSILTQHSILDKEVMTVVAPLSLSDQPCLPSSQWSLLHANHVTALQQRKTDIEKSIVEPHALISPLEGCVSALASHISRLTSEVSLFISVISISFVSHFYLIFISFVSHFYLICISFVSHFYLISHALSLSLTLTITHSHYHSLSLSLTLTLYQALIALQSIEVLTRKQLIAALGKEVSATDLSLYMEYHDRLLFRPQYAPRYAPFCFLFCCHSLQALLLCRPKA